MNFLRGWFGEKKSAFIMWLSLDSETYRRFHNVILPSKNGSAQIDHLLVSPYGLFIVETKNKGGWIFGAEVQSDWTQIIFKEKYSFQNPLRQAFRQKKVLSEFLGLSESKIHTVIHFVGDCEFKTPMPYNVINSGLGRFIKGFRSQILSDEEVSQVIHAIEKNASKSTLTTRDHIRSLHNRLSSTTICPNCGSHLIERTVKHGPYAGSKFLGCENFPRCRYTRNT